MPKITGYEPIVGFPYHRRIANISRQTSGKGDSEHQFHGCGWRFGRFLIAWCLYCRNWGGCPMGFYKRRRSCFNATKKFHNTLHRKSEEITPQMFEIFMRQAREILTQSRFMGTSCLSLTHNPLSWLKKVRAGQQMDMAMPIDVSTPQQTGMGHFGAVYSPI